MFGPPGHAYVFTIYGMYPCFNVVTDPEGHPAAVLVRAVENVAGLARDGSGPGRVCLAMGIERGHYGLDLTGGALRLERGEPAPGPARIVTGPRVNVDYAGEWAARPYRFALDGNPAVSRPRPFSVPRRSATAAVMSGKRKTKPAARAARGSTR
jgi:DNA-3-methyladenine glycosylase